MQQANLLQSLGWAVLNSLWQMALLWILFQVITALARHSKPAFKSGLAASFLVTGFAWFLFTFLQAQYQPVDQHVIQWYGTEPSEPVNTWLAKWLPVTSVFYLLLLFIPLLRFIRNYRYVQVLRHYGLSKPGPEWRIYVQDISKRMGIKKPVHIWISEWVTSPVTIGYLKPVILVPMAAVNNLSTGQMEAVLLHELAHIRRYDYLLNLVLTFIRTLLYFNPFVRSFISIVETEREKSCDQMVLQFQYDSYDYASALLSLEKISRSQQLLVLGAAGNGKELLGRIEYILGVETRKKPSIRRFTSTLAAIFYILSLNALFLLGRAVNGSGNSNRDAVMSSQLSEVQLAGNRMRQLSDMAQLSELSRQVRNRPHAIGELAAHPEWAVPASSPNLIPVRFDPPPAPDIELSPGEEAMVKDAVQSSRKVLESSQWKLIEKNLADVFSKQEKEELKNAFRNEMNKFNWSKWEDKLREAYDNVNWEKVNTQLNEALSMMKTDSLVKVYNEAMVSISKARKELSEKAMEGIPDSDISMKSLAEKQRQLQKEINRLKLSRNKKIIDL